MPRMRSLKYSNPDLIFIIGSKLKSYNVCIWMGTSGMVLTVRTCKTVQIVVQRSGFFC